MLDPFYTMNYLESASTAIVQFEMKRDAPTVGIREELGAAERRHPIELHHSLPALRRARNVPAPAPAAPSSVRPTGGRPVISWRHTPRYIARSRLTVTTADQEGDRSVLVRGARGEKTDLRSEWRSPGY